MKMTITLDNEVNRYISLLQIEEVEKGNRKPTKEALVNLLARKGMEIMQKEETKPATGK